MQPSRGLSGKKRGLGILSISNARSSLGMGGADSSKKILCIAAKYGGFLLHFYRIHAIFYM